MSLLIIITGSPATGKTAFAQRLSKELEVPAFCKDFIKISLAENIPISNQEESTRLSKATVSVMINIAQTLLSVGSSLILEANFRPYEGEWIDALLKKYNRPCLTYLFGGEKKSLAKRFIERDTTEERHEANRTFKLLSVEEYEEAYKIFDGFKVRGNTVCVDATSFDNIDYEALINIAAKELSDSSSI
ncbi:MAG: ATP-binding protein [Clostridiales bacterium]|nr:ATP-binding protein [Clostridiales bacterium]